HRACNQENGNRTPIDLKAPFRQFDFLPHAPTELVLRTEVRVPDSDFLSDLSALFDPESSLSKSDILLLRSTSVDTGPAGSTHRPTDGLRRVAGIKDFGKAGDGSLWALRPEVSAYLANEAAGLRIATQSVREFHDVVDAEHADAEAAGFSFWTR